MPKKGLINYIVAISFITFIRISFRNYFKNHRWHRCYQIFNLLLNFWPTCCI